MATYSDNPTILVSYHEPMESKEELVEEITHDSSVTVEKAKLTKEKSQDMEFHKVDVNIAETKRSRYRFRWKIPIPFTHRSRSIGLSESVDTPSTTQDKFDENVENNYITVSNIDPTKLGKELMAQKEAVLKSIKSEDSSSKSNTSGKNNDKKSNVQVGDNQQKGKGGLFKNFGKTKSKAEVMSSTTLVVQKPVQKSIPSTSTPICSECPPPKASKFTVETISPQLVPIYQKQELLHNQCNHNDTVTNATDSVKSKKLNKGVSTIKNDKTNKLLNLEYLRFRSNSGTYHSGSHKLPDPMTLPLYEPFSSLTFSGTPLKSADDDSYWVTDETMKNGYFKKLSRSSISKSDQNLVYNEPSKRIEEALSQSMISSDIPNATIQVAYRHGVNRVTENDQIVILSKTSTRDRSTYLSEGVHRLDEAETFFAFFQHSTCYDLMPHSSKLVVLDSRLQVGKAFRALIFNGVRAAIIWQVELQQYVGILTITDFIHILNLYVTQTPDSTVDIETETIDKWREKTGIINKPLLFVRPESSLFIALKELKHHRVHRLPVIDVRSGNVLHIITHKRLLRYLYIKKSKIPKKDFLLRTVEEVNVGTFDKVFTATLDTSISEVLNIFETNHISAVPIVDPTTKRLIDLYAKFDCIYLASTGNYKDLNQTVDQALKFRSQTSFSVQTCKKSDTLDFVMEKIVMKEVHRLVVINNEKDRFVEGIVSLADLLHYFVLRLSDRHSSGNVLDGISCCSDLNVGPVVAGTVETTLMSVPIEEQPRRASQSSSVHTDTEENFLTRVK